mmetsp:Transcript_26458/g.74021  ORF Transcript_26458/g.74021 Transcript_26458/m.74021 type:complete len:255 (+) Transcript_26458:657-1421(+)
MSAGNLQEQHRQQRRRRVLSGIALGLQQRRIRDAGIGVAIILPHPPACRFVHVGKHQQHQLRHGSVNALGRGEGRHHVRGRLGPRGQSRRRSLAPVRSSVCRRKSKHSHAPSVPQRACGGSIRPPHGRSSERGQILGGCHGVAVPGRHGVALSGQRQFFLFCGIRENGYRQHNENRCSNHRGRNLVDSADAREEHQRHDSQRAASTSAERRIANQFGRYHLAFLPPTTLRIRVQERRHCVELPHMPNGQHLRHL